LVVIFNLCAGGSAQGNLVINATFDSTITSDPNAATIEGTINSVIALYQASFPIRSRWRLRFTRPPAD